MKAVRVYEFGEPEVMRYEEVEDSVAGAGEVVVKVHAIGVNPVDTYIRAGKYGSRPMPYTPGGDAAGVVESVGTGALDFEPGDRVYVASPVTGTYAEKVLVKAANVYRLPGNVSFEQGAGISVPYGTAFRALFDKAQVKTGDTVLVHGASGGVGLAAVQLALSGLMEPKNLTVIGTAGTEKGIALVRQQGAQHVVNHKTPGYTDEILRLTEGKGVNVILEMLANVNLDKDMDMIAKFGRIVVIGNRGTIEIDPRKLMTRDSTVTGMRLDNGSLKEIGFIHSTLYTGLMNETLRPIIHKVFPLSDAAKAHEAVLADGSLGKIILVP